VSKGGGLGRKTRAAISWTALGAVASNAMRLVTLAVLGRVLAPADFGVVAAAMTVIMAVKMLRDFGVGLALVQRVELEREHVEVAFTVSVVQGVLLTAAIAVLADPIADFFDMQRSTWVIRALSLQFLFRSFGLVPSFQLQRALKFRELAVIDFAGYLVGSVTAIGLAIAGWGVWSLVVGYSVEAALGTVALCVVEPPPWAMRWHPRHLRELLGFGIGKTLATFANYFAMQGDYMVIGRMLDKTQLGLYQRAYELVRFPNNVFTSVAGSVLFSAFAKIQHEPERMGRLLRRSMFASAIVLLPASAGLIVLAPEVIRMLMGGQWSGAVWPFRIMALTMLFRTTYKLGGMVGRSTGEVFTIARWQVIYAALVIGGAAISVRWGILGVACTTSLAITVHFLAMTRIGLRMTNLRARDLLLAHVAPVAFTAAVGGAAWAVATGLRAAHVSYVVVAIAATVAGSAVYVALVATALKRATGDWPWLKETLIELVRKRRKKRGVGDAQPITVPEP
jgi:O-antigen/teichoic acid export membrane protein